jgi:hypothetical protein
MDEEGEGGRRCGCLHVLGWLVVLLLLWTYPGLDIPLQASDAGAPPHAAVGCERELGRRDEESGL